MKKLIMMMGLLIAMTFTVNAQIVCGGGDSDATGRVVDSFGRGVKQVTVTATTIDSRSDTTEPATRIAYTNSAGYYNFNTANGLYLCISSDYTFQGYHGHRGYTNLLFYSVYNSNETLPNLIFP